MSFFFCTTCFGVAKRDHLAESTLLEIVLFFEVSTLVVECGLVVELSDDFGRGRLAFGRSVLAEIGRLLELIGAGNFWCKSFFGTRCEGILDFGRWLGVGGLIWLGRLEIGLCGLTVGFAVNLFKISKKKIKAYSLLFSSPTKKSVSYMPACVLYWPQSLFSAIVDPSYLEPRHDQLVGVRQIWIFQVLPVWPLVVAGSLCFHSGSILTHRECSSLFSRFLK